MSGSDLQDDLEMVGGDDDADALASGSDSNESAPQEDPKDKRINDLMSKWQSTDAENKRLRAQLEAQKGGDAGDDSAPAAGKDQTSAADEGFNAILRESARETLFKSDPRLERFGFKPDVIAGATAAEMQESLAKQKAFLDAVEGKLRNELLAEHGLTNDAAGGGSEKPRDFASMSSEDFQALVNRVTSGG